MFAPSSTVPAAKVTKYCVLLARLAVGLMVSVLPENVSKLLLAALKLSTRVPLAEPERISMLPVPRAIVSLKVSTTLSVTATLVAASVGLKLLTVGAVVSALENMPGNMATRSTVVPLLLNFNDSTLFSVEKIWCEAPLTLFTWIPVELEKMVN